MTDAPAAPPTRFERVARAIDQVSIWSGKVVAWLIVPMFIVLFYEVMARKLGHPTMWANDIATMCYGAHFFIAGAYTLYLQKHIRTDFLTQHLAQALDADPTSCAGRARAIRWVLDGAAADAVAAPVPAGSLVDAVRALLRGMGVPLPRF